ncbi:MAG: primosomal protein N' [Flavobacteriales bacterium]|nr:primosomal protein N' [Flavobacteriales bacterium]
MDSLALFVDVIIPLPLAGTFTYRVPRTLENDVEVGKRVIVQFGRKKLYTGIILRVHDRPPEAYQAKYMEDLLDDAPIVFPHQLQFWQWMHTYYMCHSGDVMNAAIPSGLKLSSESRLAVHPDFSGEVDDLEEEELRILEALQNNEVLTMDEIATIVRKTHVHPVVRSMIAKRVVVQYEELQQKYKPKTQMLYSLASFLSDEDALKEVFEALKKAKKQLDALMIFLQNARQKKEKNTAIEKRSLIEDGASAAALTALEKKGILIRSIEEIGRLKEKPSWTLGGVQLTEGQDKIFSNINEQFREKDALLLHGVTGSGKTEVYITLIEKLLEQKKQVLYMLPEIALTTQIIYRLQEHFGERVGIYHSRMSNNERVEVWQKQLSDRPYDVILGARSAIFLPFARLGMIILDEEHEHTYKQHDPAPRYHARDAASHLTKKHGAKLLLGSATPSIEAYFNAQRGKIGFSHLSKRFGGLKLPHVEVCDLRKERKEQTMKGPFSSQLLQRIKETLDRRLQVIIFQNRRGYSSYVQCDNCGWVPDCLNCDISLTYHKYSQDVRCHYCGHTDSSPNICPKCKATFIKTRGFGTEQVEEELSVHFPEITVARMDLDTTRGKYAYQRIITDFEEQRIHILVGTQMVTKGLDFDHVGLVGILNADQLLNYPDFRAFERAYQLMAQVSGRAGRKGKQGLVVVQTGSPDHFIIEKVVQNDYEAMYAAELEQRKAYRYPPFIRMIRIVVKHRDRDKVDAAATKLAEVLQPIPNMLLLGPEYPMVQRIRNQYHKYILLKMGGADLKGRKQRIFQLIQEVRSIKEFRSVRFLPDVDPL